MSDVIYCCYGQFPKKIARFELLPTANQLRFQGIPSISLFFIDFFYIVQKMVNLIPILWLSGLNAPSRRIFTNLSTASVENPETQKPLGTFPCRRQEIAAAPLVIVD